MNYRLADEITAMASQERRTIIHNDNSASAEKQGILHTVRLKEIVSSEGWPAPDMVGEAASRGAFMLLKRSDDREFKAECLHKMKENFAVSKNYILKEQIHELERNLSF